MRNCPDCGHAWKPKGIVSAATTCPRCGRAIPALPSYIVGLDLGQAADYTAVTILEGYESGYQLRYLHRFEVGTPYPKMVGAVAGMLAQPPLSGSAELVVDHTGVGRPVVDLLRDAGLSPIAVTITGGDAVTSQGQNWRVPKRDLVGALVVLFQNGSLKIAQSLPLAPVLTKELLDFKVKISASSGHDSYEAWREGSHDDLVLAAALAAWWAKRGTDTGNFLAAFGGLASAPLMAGMPLTRPGGVVRPVDGSHPGYAEIRQR